MTFKNLTLKHIYDSVSDDVYNDFFNRVLSNAKLCARIGGIFSSRNFAACAEGMQEFIKNDGKMQLVLASSFSPEDAKAVDEGINRAEDIIAERWIKDFNEIKDKFVRDHTKALAWMIANEYLEIRVAIAYHTNGKILDASQLHGINDFSLSTAIFWDNSNNAISLSGNINFEDRMFGDRYYFNVFRSWDESERKWVQQHSDLFSSYWEKGEVETQLYKVRMVPLPSAVKDGLCKIAPKSKSEVVLKRTPRLRNYQKAAVSSWLQNAGQGIFEMATGTGKTFTAIGCIKELEQMEDSFIVIVVCPFVNLMHQWAQELEKWDIDSIKTAGNTLWRQRVQDNIILVESRKRKMQVFITSYDTYTNPDFIRIVSDCRLPIMIIADEVHHSGSPEYSKGLVQSYKYRLGLTATLERYFDPMGTRAVENYFKKTVFEISLEQAIREGFLVSYYYYPIYVDLTKEEYKRYKKETKTIALYYNSDNEEDRLKLQKALIRRSKIIRDAQLKITAFQSFVNKNSNLKYTLIYCSENQIIDVKRILRSVKPRPIIPAEITAKKPSDPRERQEILRSLAHEHYQAIVAIGVLDEGADVPEAKNCILLANTGNPKQFIQRRGRVLRRFNALYKDGSKKEYASIYDFIVVPDTFTDLTPAEKKVEFSILSSQLRRQEIMGSIARNSKECLESIVQLKNKFGIV